MKDRKQGDVDRRDERQDRSTPEIPKVRSRKDRKRWCRGRDGVEHRPVCRRYQEVKNVQAAYAEHWRLLVCSECGRELDHWYPMPTSWSGLGRLPRRSPPPWVTS